MKKTHFTALAALIVFGLAAAFPVRAASSSGIDEKKIEEITKAVAPSVVRVEARNGVFKVATGVVIDKDGSIVTTALISPRDEKITVFTTDGKSHNAEFKGLDTQTNIAVIQVKGANLAPIVFGKSSELRPGVWIGVIGLSPERTPAVTQGIVSSVAEDRARLNVWVVPGMSGSPVVNANGQMIGLLRGAYGDEQPIVFEFREQQVVGSGTVFSRAEAASAGMAVAVPVDIVGSVSADIRKNGKVERGWLGVSTDIENGKVVIVSVDPKSPAELAKIREGDLVVGIGERAIATSQALSWEIRSRKPGTDVVLKIERDGKPLDVKVKLGEYSEEDARRELELNFPNFFKILPPSRPSQPPAPTTPRRPLRPDSRFFEFFSRKYIGVTVQALTKELAAFFGVKEGAGLLVAEVTDDTPAKRAGLKAGDVILKADGKALETTDDLSEMIQDRKKGDKIKLEVVRDKKSLTIEVEIDEEREGSGFWPYSFWPRTEFNLRNSTEDLRRAVEEAQKEYGKQSEGQLKKLREQEQKTKDGLRKILRIGGVYYKI